MWRMMSFAWATGSAVESTAYTFAGVPTSVGELGLNLAGVSGRARESCCVCGGGVWTAG
jgi:hypothetical protein